MRKKNRSLVRQVVLLPMTVMLFIVLTTIGVCGFAILNMQQRMLDGYESAVKIALDRIDMRLDQIETAFVNYWVYDTNHEHLKALPAGTPKESYIKYQAGTVSWMNQMADNFPEMEGIVVYYGNLDLLQFRGKLNARMHSLLTALVHDEGAAFNTWRVVSFDGKGYLYTLRRFGQFCGGAWLPVNGLMDSLGPDGSFPGIFYLSDGAGNLVFPHADGERTLPAQEQGRERVRLGGESFYQRRAAAEKRGIFLGALFPRQRLVENMPPFLILILLMAAVSAALVPLTTRWLRRRIARPVSAMDQGMRRIGEGHLDYRIPLPPHSADDEFGYLISRFNQMVDELNDLEYRLYISKIRQQQTELRYISQQIRPHFILNALNIIYTYDESEFPLVKKMVLYLAEYFRYIVNLKVDFVQAWQELRHVENYLKIQKERYTDRFDFIVEWEKQADSFQIPPLLLQTFVENCIKYGMKSEGKSLICVMAVLENEKLKISVMDTGDGFPPKVLEQLGRFLETREAQPDLGVGLQNAIERMDALYGQRADIRFYNKPTGGAAVELRLPPRPESAGAGQEVNDD